MFMLQHSQSNCSLKHNTQILYLAYAGRYSSARGVASTNLSMIAAHNLLKLEPSSASGVAHGKKCSRLLWLGYIFELELHCSIPGTATNPMVFMAGMQAHVQSLPDTELNSAGCG